MMCFYTASILNKDILFKQLMFIFGPVQEFEE